MTDMYENLVKEKEVTLQPRKKAGETASLSDILKDMSELSKSTDYPISIIEAQRMFNLFKSAIYAELASGAKIQMTGFLSFVPSYRTEKKVFNILTKEPFVASDGVNINVKTGGKIRDISKSYDESVIDVYRQKYKASKEKSDK